jgi:hypothetical protein
MSLNDERMEIPSTFSECQLFLYEHIFYKLYVQVKFNFISI